MEPAEEYVKNLSYEDFRKFCGRVAAMSDQELASHFGAHVEPKEMRMKYQYMLASMTPGDYEKLKSANSVNMRKFKGNNYFSQEKFNEAIKEYNEGLGQLQQILDPEIKQSTESALRQNLAIAYLKIGKYAEAIKECELVLGKEPYNVRGIYRIALAYKMTGNTEKAAEYLRRVVIRKSTDENLAKLHKELVRPNEALFLETLSNHVAAQDKAAVQQELKRQGFVLSAEEANKFLLALPAIPSPATLKAKIVELDQKRRYEYFLKYPIMDDLLEDPILLAEVEQTVNDRESDFTKRMLGMYQGLTHDQLKDAVKGIRTRIMVDKFTKYLPSKKVFTILLGAIIMLVISYHLYKHFSK